MASTKLAFRAIAVLLLQVSWCAVSQQQPEQDAVMVWKSFQAGGGNGPAACDGNYQDDGSVVALSTEWYADGNRCGKVIYIERKDTKDFVWAVVVDKVDGGSMIAATTYVWQLLGYDPNMGQVAVTWFDEGQ